MKEELCSKIRDCGIDNVPKHCYGYHGNGFEVCRSLLVKGIIPASNSSDPAERHRIFFAPDVVCTNELWSPKNAGGRNVPAMSVTPYARTAMQLDFICDTLGLSTSIAEVREHIFQVLYTYNNLFPLDQGQVSPEDYHGALDDAAEYSEDLSESLYWLRDKIKSLVRVDEFEMMNSAFACQGVIYTFHHNIMDFHPTSRREDDHDEAELCVCVPDGLPLQYIADIIPLSDYDAMLLQQSLFHERKGV